MTHQSNEGSPALSLGTPSIPQTTGNTTVNSDEETVASGAVNEEPLKNTSTSLPVNTEDLIETNTSMSSDDGNTTPLVTDDSTSPSLTTSSIKTNTNGTSDDGTATSFAVTGGSTSQGTHQYPESTTLPVSTVPPTSSAKELEMDLDGSATSTAKELGLDINGSTSSTDQTSIQDTMDVDEEIKQGSTDIITVAPPGWLAALNMDVYLKECSDTKAWKGLVQSFYEFEGKNTINGVYLFYCITIFAYNPLPVESTDFFAS